MKIPPLLISTVLFAVFIFGMTQVYAQYGDGFSPVEHYPTINDTKLQLLVMNSTEFKERTLGYNYTFAGINYDWISKGNNNYDFGDARVTFFVFGFGNGTTKGEVFNVNSQMKIKSIFEYNADYPPVGYFSTTCYGGCIPSELSQLNKKLETAKGIIESMMMGHNTSGIPFNEVGIERNFTLGVGIDSTKATLSEEQYLKKIKEIVGDIPIKITFGQIQLLSNNVTNNSTSGNDIATPILSPLKQFKSGVVSKDVKCNKGLQFIMKKENGQFACVKKETANQLFNRGWGIIPLGGLPTYQNTSIFDTGIHPFSINVVNANFTLNYNISGNNKLLDANMDSQSKSLVLSMSASSNGTLSISIPRALLDSKSAYSNQDMKFIILIDKQEVKYTETTSITARTLTIPFELGAKKIEITAPMNV